MKEFKNYCGRGFAYNTYVWGNDKLFPNSRDEVIKKKDKYDPRLIAKYNVEDDSETTKLYAYYAEEVEEEYWVIGTELFDKIEIDGVEVSISDIDSDNGNYQLSEGEHTVKYTLSNPTTIGNSVFSECRSLTSITIPNSVTSIGNSVFSECSGLTSIGPVGSGASVEIPNGVTTIGDFAFYKCTGLTSVTIPNTVTTIGRGAFQGCIRSLTSITIPNSVTSIGDNAFQGCRSLTSIISLATTAPTIKSSTFQNVNTGGTLYVPSGSSGYDTWMGTGNFYLGKYSWTKIEQ